MGKSCRTYVPKASAKPLFKCLSFLLMSQIEILKNFKNTHLATNFSKGDILNLVTWPTFRFYIFLLFFPKSTSGAVIP